MKNKKGYQPLLLLIFITSLFFLFSTELACQGDTAPELHDGNYVVKLIKDEKINISSHLIGFNTVYAYESDSIWSDGKIVRYLKDVKASVIRYPGGTVSSYYHWNNLTGEGWKDSWDPVNLVTPKAKSSFMDLDEFIALVQKTNVTPLVGINMSSGRRWNRQEDGIKEALELMKYCRDKNFKVKYWYLDNEPYQSDSNGGSKTIEEYAGLINLFAPRMKEFDPDIKIIVNWGSAFKNKKNEYQKLFGIAGKNIDIIDAHWYWSWSNATFQKWLLKTPLEVWTGENYMSEIAFFHQMVKEFGYPDIKLASLEWNVGPIRENQLTPHQCALIQAEMMMQFMAGGLDLSTFWPIHGPGTSVAARSFVRRSDRSAQPVYKIFEFLGKLQGGNVSGCEVVNTQPNVFILVASDNTGNNSRVCFLNKNNTNIKVDVKTDLFKNMKISEAKAFILRDQGNNSDIKTVELSESSGSGISFVASGISLTMLTFNKK